MKIDNKLKKKYLIPLVGILFPLSGFGLLFYRRSTRVFNQEAIDKYKGISEFQYQTEKLDNSLMQRFLELLSSFIKSILPNFDIDGGFGFFEIIIYLVIAVAIFLLIYSVFKDGVGAVLKRNKPINNVVFDEISNSTNLDELILLINKAKESGNYKTAIRLWYIFLIKNLNDRGLIAWGKEKTNKEYLIELVKIDMKPEFKRLTQMYEFIWFGDFFIDREQFISIEVDFQKFNGVVSQG